MIDTLLTWLIALRWPLTAVLGAVGLYFWVRRPERNEPWTPPCEPSGGVPVEEAETAAAESRTETAPSAPDAPDADPA